MAVISAVLNNRQHACYEELAETTGMQHVMRTEKTGNVLHAERTEITGNMHVMSGTETMGNMLCRTENHRRQWAKCMERTS